MARLYECPSCGGCGLRDCDPRHDEDEILDCVECGGTGWVDWKHREEYLAWQRRCEGRELPERRRA
jgi:DnaJ-class molecular chaperone